MAYSQDQDPDPQVTEGKFPAVRGYGMPPKTRKKRPLTNSQVIRLLGHIRR